MTARAQALTLDYDGTLAHDGVVDPATVAALSRTIDRHVRLILVTGRRLSSVATAFPQLSLFDRVVAENGAILYEPRTKRSRILAPPPPESLLKALRNAGVPFDLGSSVIATVLPFHDKAVAAIRESGLSWHVATNKRDVMILPSGVTKVTGLIPALEEVGVTWEDTVGIGDAENDLSFLERCGLAIAVANAVPSLKAIAHHVTVGARGDGVVEAINSLLIGTIDERWKR